MAAIIQYVLYANLFLPLIGAGLVAGAVHLLLDSLTGNGIYLTRKSRWRLAGLPHDDLMLNGGFGFAGLLLILWALMPLLTAWGVIDQVTLLMKTLTMLLGI